MYNPEQDGPTMWRVIHLMACNAVTPRKRELYVNWLNSLKESFPCEKCRLHLIKNLEEPTEDGSVGPGPVEPYSNSNVSLFRHSWKLHDTVNRQLNKPKEQCLTFEQAFEIYFKTKVPITTVQSTEVHPAAEKPRAIRSIKASQSKRSTPVRQSRTQERFLAAASYKAPQTVLSHNLHESVHESSLNRSDTMIQESVKFVEEPIQMPASLQCTSCGMPEEPIIAAEPKVDFDTFRAKSRRVFTAKN